MSKHMTLRILILAFIIVFIAHPETTSASIYNYDMNSRLQSETYIKNNIQYQKNSFMTTMEVYWGNQINQKII